MSLTLSEVVNLTRYPIENLDGEGATMLARCRYALQRSAMCYLPGFLTNRALTLLQAEVMSVRQRAFRNTAPRPPYAWRDPTRFPKDHPVAQRLPQSLGSVTRNHFDANGALISSFEQPAITEFVRRCLGFDSLYPVECPYLSVNVKVMVRGDQHAWHFDQNDGVVSLLIQAAEEGGDFEYVPYIRDEEDENYAAVDALFAGETEGIVRPPLEAGTFCLFKGRRSIHRVSEITRDNPPRLMALFSYDHKPGMTYPNQTLQAVLGENFDAHTA